MEGWCKGWGGVVYGVGRGGVRGGEGGVWGMEGWYKGWGGVV